MNFAAQFFFTNCVRENSLLARRGFSDSEEYDPFWHRWEISIASLNLKDFSKWHLPLTIAPPLLFFVVLTQLCFLLISLSVFIPISSNFPKTSFTCFLHGRHSLSHLLYVQYVYSVENVAIQKQTHIVHSYTSNVKPPMRVTAQHATIICQCCSPVSVSLHISMLQKIGPSSLLFIFYMITCLIYYSASHCLYSTFYNFILFYGKSAWLGLSDILFKDRKKWRHLICITWCMFWC